MKKLLITPVIASMFLVGAVAHAQTADTELPNPGMLPDSPLYFLERAAERMSIFFTFNNKAKAERLLRQSEERLAEIEVLLQREKVEKVKETAEHYQERVDEALERAGRARERNEENIDDVFERIAENAARHQEILGDVYDRVPEDAKDAIERALEMSAQGYENALRAVSRENAEGVLNRMREHIEEIGGDLDDLREAGIPVRQFKIYDTDSIRDLMDDMMDHEPEREMEQEREMYQEGIERERETQKQEMEQEREMYKDEIEHADEIQKQEMEREREMMKQEAEHEGEDNDLY